MRFSKETLKKKKSAPILRGAVILAVLTLLVIPALTGCFLLPSEPIAVKGTWNLDSSYTWEGTDYISLERWTISGSTIHYEKSYDGTTYTTTYRAEIVSFDNNGLNGGDTSLTAGRAVTENPGYAVIRYTEVDGPGTGVVDTYNVFRWADNNAAPDSMDFTQGYFNTGDAWPNNINGGFNTAAGAEAGAVNATGYFAYSSDGAGPQS
jgi:hypothetical protein